MGARAIANLDNGDGRGRVMNAAAVARAVAPVESPARERGEAWSWDSALGFEYEGARYSRALFVRANLIGQLYSSGAFETGSGVFEGLNLYDLASVARFLNAKRIGFRSHGLRGWSLRTVKRCFRALRSAGYLARLPIDNRRRFEAGPESRGRAFTIRSKPEIEQAVSVKFGPYRQRTRTRRGRGKLRLVSERSPLSRPSTGRSGAVSKGRSGPYRSPKPLIASLCQSDTSIVREGSKPPKGLADRKQAEAQCWIERSVPSPGRAERLLEPAFLLIEREAKNASGATPNANASEVDLSTLPPRHKNPPPPWARTKQNLARETEAREARFRRGDPAVAESLPERFRGERVSIAHARKRDGHDTREAIELLDAGIEIAVSLACDRGDSPALRLSAKDRDYIRRLIRFERQKRFGAASPAIVLFFEACESIARRADWLNPSNAEDELFPARLKLIGDRKRYRGESDETMGKGTLLACSVLSLLERAS